MDNNEITKAMTDIAALLAQQNHDPKAAEQAIGIGLRLLENFLKNMNDIATAANHAAMA